MDAVNLAHPGIGVRVGFDCWRRDGSLAFRTLRQSEVFARRAAYFRVNSTGEVYRIVSRYKTVRVRPQFVQSVPAAS
jgi:hypothetical protein